MSIITLLTDFGSGSPYQAEMKGVLLASCRATVVDVTHDVPPRDIARGAYLLAAVARTFPTGTVHLAVVDPGVGTARQPLAIASGGQFFVGPDNGLLMPAARALGVVRSFAIDATAFARRPLSATFHGRDLFVPAAAALAAGLPIERLGRPASPPVELPADTPERSAGRVRGQVIYRDPFGNLVTNIPGSWLLDLPERLVLEHRRGRHAIRRARTYADAADGELLSLVGSSGTVEIALNAQEAGTMLGLDAGDAVIFIDSQ